jgi:septum site-determining protein MinC
MKAKRAVEIKGSSLPVLRVVVRDGDAESLRNEIDDTVGRARALLAEALTVLDLRERTSDGGGAILEAVRAAGVRIAGVLVTDESECDGLQGAGVPLIDAPEPVEPATRTRTPPPLPGAAAVVEELRRPPPSAAPTMPLYLTRPLRSGQRFYAQGRDLVVLAPTSRGAELIADGSVYGFARLRGRVLAGASGDLAARIIATDLDAELVAIAGVYRTLEADETAPLAGRTVSVTLALDANGDERLALVPLEAPAQPQPIR